VRALFLGGDLRTFSVDLGREGRVGRSKFVMMDREGRMAGKKIDMTTVEKNGWELGETGEFNGI